MKVFLSVFCMFTVIACGGRQSTLMTESGTSEASVDKSAAEALSADLRRLNVLFFSLLKEMGKAEEIVCKGCGTTNVRPLLDGIEIDPRCAECGLLIDGITEEAFKDADLMDDSEE